MRHVRLIGTPRIEGADGDALEVKGQKPWAVLARILLADRPLTRRELSAELFPDADDPLGSLRWCLAALRRALGSPDLLTGDPVRSGLGPSITVDVHELWDGSFDARSAGELLEGIDPRCGSEFSTWLLVARQQVASRITAFLRDQIICAISRRECNRAIELAELLARRCPFDEGAHVLLVKSLILSDDPQAALEHVVAVEQLFRSELGCDPSPALRSAARARVADPPPGVSAATLAATLLDSGRAALSAGAIDAGLDCLRRASAQAELARDDVVLAQCFLQLGSALVHAVRGFDDEGSVLLEQAAHIAQEVGDRQTAAVALQERGYADSLAGRRMEAQRHLDHAGVLAEHDDRLQAGVRAVAAFNLSDWGRHNDAIAAYDEAIEAARRSGDRRREAWALGLGGWTLHLAGREVESTGWLTACLDLVHDLRWVSFEPWPVTVLAEANLADVRGDETSPAFERWFAMSCQLDDPCWEGASGRVLALHYAQRQEHDLALRWIVEARTRCERKSDTWTGLLGEILLTEAEIRADSGDLPGASSAVRQTIELAARAQLDGLLPRGLDVLSRCSG
jgi:DNA-binding SARP family transcriptional activator